MLDSWDKMGIPRQGMIVFDFQMAEKEDAFFNKKSSYDQKVAKALVAYIEQLKAQNTTGEPIYVVGMSNGTIITDLALEYGMKVDGVVFMGPALGGYYDLTKALENTPWIKSYHSHHDEATKSNGGGAYFGFWEKKGLQMKWLDDFHHGSGVGEHAEKAVWEKQAPKPGFVRTPDGMGFYYNFGTTPWVSYRFGRDHLAFAVPLPVGTNRSFPATLQRYDSGILKYPAKVDPNLEMPEPPAGGASDFFFGLGGH